MSPTSRRPRAGSSLLALCLALQLQTSLLGHWAEVEASPQEQNPQNFRQQQQQDTSNQFTCGRLFYRTFHLDQQRNVLYVGAM